MAYNLHERTGNPAGKHTKWETNIEFSIARANTAETNCELTALILGYIYLTHGNLG